MKPTHTCIGQELPGVVLGLNAQENDIFVSNHRCHGHYLGLTQDYKGLAGEIVGSRRGLNQGIGGSQHLLHPQRFYSNGILGGLASFSCGLAYNLKKTNAIVVNFLGDGVFGEGAIYEATSIFASVFSCPVLFLVEDNKISQSTETHTVFAGDIEQTAIFQH